MFSEIVQKYSQFKYEENVENIDKEKITALGIGDVMISLVLLKNGLMEGPIYINLKYFLPNIIYDNPYNFLEFRLKLLEHLCFHNNMNTDQIVLLNENNHFNYLNQYMHLISYIDNWKLNFEIKPLPENLKNNKYIIFHTKCRFSGSFDYINLRNELNIFYQNYKTDYDIVLLGEREIEPYSEEKIHSITTIYNELLELKKNNNVIDLTIKNIYKELDFDQYLNDISIVHNAEYNIIVGLGGHFVSSLIFSKGPVINFISNVFNSNINSIQKNDFITKDFSEYLDYIQKLV
jgi:hypothetical protein